MKTNILAFIVCILNNVSSVHAGQCVNKVAPLCCVASDWCVENFVDDADDSNAEKTADTMATEDVDSEDDSDNTEGGTWQCVSLKVFTASLLDDNDKQNR